MSNEMIQNALVAVIVIAAVGFLVWRRVRTRRAATPFCENCPGYRGPAKSSAPPLVRLGRTRDGRPTNPPRA